MTNTPPPNLRMADLIAKTAKVTLKDTVRVLLATSAVSRMYCETDTPSTAPTPAPDWPVTRPSPENVAACEQASFALREGDTHARGEIDEILQKL